MKRCACSAAGLLVCALIVRIAGFPALPTADPLIDTITYDASVRVFLRDNLFAIFFFIASLICGLFLLFYDLYAKMKNELSSGVSDAAGVLGAFVILAGIWILTDSRFFLVYKDTSEKTSFENGIVLVSFLSFLLLPVVYSEFLKCFVKGKRFIRVIERLMVINLILFLALMAAGAPSFAYLAVLFIQHGLIVILIAMNIKLFLKDLFSRQNIREHNLAMGTTAFGIISVCALITFLFEEYRVYPIVYGIGLLVLIFFMVKMLFAEIAEVHRKQLQTEIYKEMAYTDALTGLQNRNAFIRDTDLIVDATGLGVLIMDINDIKKINDTYGHECGDVVIKAAADVIRNAFGGIGEGYRIGGDEFVVICEHVGETALKTAIAEAEAMQVDFNSKNEAQLIIATGYSVSAQSNEKRSFNSLFIEADQRMYEDKSSKKKIQ